MAISKNYRAVLTNNNQIKSITVYSITLESDYTEYYEEGKRIAENINKNPIRAIHGGFVNAEKMALKHAENFSGRFRRGFFETDEKIDNVIIYSSFHVMEGVKNIEMIRDVSFELKETTTHEVSGSSNTVFKYKYFGNSE